MVSEVKVKLASLPQPEEGWPSGPRLYLCVLVFPLRLARGDNHGGAPFSSFSRDSCHSAPNSVISLKLKLVLAGHPRLTTEAWQGYQSWY